MTGINTIPFTPRTIKTLNCKVDTANTDLTGATGTTVQFKNANSNYTTGTDGVLLSTLRINLTETTTAGSIAIYISDGTTKWLVANVAVTAVTVSAGTPGFASTSTLNLYVPPSYTIFASTYISKVAHLTIDCLEY